MTGPQRPYAAHTPAEGFRGALRELLADPWSAAIGLGIAWMMIGMLVMPSGISYNPGKGYQASLIVLLYIPALWLALRRRAQVWRQLWPLPAFRVFLLLLAWATLSLAWAHLHRPGDEFARVLSVGLFVLGWHAFAGQRPLRAHALLTVAGWGMAACALAYSMIFLTHPQADDERIVGEGVIATANYAAAAMGAACVWLAQMPRRRHAVAVACVLAVLVLGLFIGLTQSRSVWLALACCVLLTPLWRRNRITVLLSAAVLLVALAVALLPLPVLMERGSSFRPQILAVALHMIAQHPLQGLGQGASFAIEVGGQHLTHSHNVLTQAAIELGLPGLLLLLALWFAVVATGWRHRRDPQGQVVLSLWVYASVVLQFDLPQLLDSPRPGWLLIWLPFALALGLAARARSPAAMHRLG